MAFSKLFKDNNDINEKAVVGFASFAIMTIFAIVDLITDSFLIITLGCFGIAEVGKIFGAKDKAPEPPAPEPNSKPGININIDGDDW